MSDFTAESMAWSHDVAILPTLDQVLDRTPLTVTPDTLAIDAIAQMSQTIANQCDLSQPELSLLPESASCILVVEGRNLLGILTERDVVLLTTAGIDLAQTTIAQVMTHSLITLTLAPETQLRSALAILAQRRIRHLPIVDPHGQLVGLVTQDRIRRVLEPANFLRLRQVAEVMSDAVICAAPTDSVFSIAQQMVTHQVSCIAIVNDPTDLHHSAIGIITERDIVQFQTIGLDLATTQAQIVMSTPLFSLRPTDSLWVAHQAMKQRQVRRLGVVGEQGELVGLMTQTDLLRLYDPMEMATILEAMQQRIEADTCELRNLTQKLQAEISTRQQTEAALQRTQQWLQQYSLQSPSAIYTIVQNSEGVVWFEYISAAVEAIHEVTAQQAIGNAQVLFDQMHPDDRAGYAAAVDWSVQNLELFSYEWRNITPSGKLKWLQATSKPERRSDGKIAWHGVVQDISDRKAAEIALQSINQQLEQQVETQTAELSEAEEQFRLLATYAPVGIFQTDATGSVIFVNHHWLQLTGLSLAQSLGTGWANALHPDDRAWVCQKWQATVAAQQESRSEFRFQTPQGRVTWVIVRSTPIRDEAGVVKSYFGTVTDITDRKRLETEQQRWLTEAETAKNQVTTILQSITDGFVAFDRDWHFTYINAQGGRILQRDPADLLGKYVWGEFEGVTETAFYREYHRAVAEQVTVEFEEFYQPLNTWFAVHAYPTAEGLAIYFQDITQRKQAEAILRESEERYRSTIEVMQEGIIFIDRNLCIQSCNASAARITGVPTEQYLGCSLADPQWQTIREDGSLFPVEQQPAAITLRTGQPCSKVVLGFYRPNGAIVWLEINSQPLFRSGETLPYAVVASFTDISDRKTAEAKIREQAALLDISGDAIYVRSLDNQILYWNQGAEKIYGWSAAEAIGKLTEDLVHTAANQIEAATATTLAQGSWQGELHKTTRSGKTVTVDSRWSLVQNYAGQPYAIFTVSTDITEKKQLEAQFLRAQRLESIGTLASGIAHDLNNILTPVLAVAQLLPRRVPQLDESNRRLLEILETNAKRGSNLVKQILAFARGGDEERRLLQVGHLLSEVAKISQQTFPRSIEVRAQVQNLWLIRANATQIHQVIMNLCVNARDAMPDGGTLTIVAENFVMDEAFARLYLEAQVGNYLKITIADTGTGIAPEVLDHIFDPFFTTKAQGQGTGLGLPTVQTIIKNHKGFLDIDTQVGQGTRFIVYLPASAAREEEVSAPSIALTGHNERILVVDDEVAIVCPIATTLEAYNYRALMSQDGIGATALYAQQAADIRLVLVDLMMPSFDGFKLIAALLKINPNVRIIAMSGSTSNEANPVTPCDGVQAFIAKPFTNQTLLQTVQEVLERN